MKYAERRLIFYVREINFEPSIYYFEEVCSLNKKLQET